MKNLSLFVSAFALFTSTSYAAINCGTLPTCESLGYTDTVANCPSSSEVLKCPFDTTKGKCQHGPSVGDLKYSLKDSDHDGWLLCDGRQFSSDSTAKYYKLFQLIGTKFCHKFTSKTDTSYATSNCNGGMFALPDYRGFFLRAATKYVTATSAVPLVSGTSSYSTAFSYMGGNTNANIYTPMYERLPNITGAGGWYENTSRIKTEESSIKNRVTGAFYLSDTEANYGAVDHDKDNRILNFDASKSSSIYESFAHVIPANYSAYVFIYAGR